MATLPLLSQDLPAVDLLEPALVPPPPSRRLTVDQAQRFAVRSLGRLGELAGDLNLLLAQPALNCSAVRKLGFADVKSGEDFGQEGCPQLGCGEEDRPALLATVGADMTQVRQMLSSISSMEKPPFTIVVIIMPFVGCESVFDAPQKLLGGLLSRQLPQEQGDLAAASMELGRSLSATRLELYDLGAEEVVCLHAGEALVPHRLLEILQKSEYMAKRVAEYISQEVKSVDDRWSVKLENAYRNFLNMLPGRFLESIPTKDASLEERCDEEGNLIGVGEYSFEGQLGAGSFGAVYRAVHPTHGLCAVKAISKKATVRGVGDLFALDREFCFLRYLGPHPNIVQAYEVMQATHFFYAAMEYGGDLHLQKFTKLTLRETGEPRLPLNMVHSFCRQEAAAIAHLHSAMVCHRDLKPENWIVGDDGRTLRLTDFGLAMQMCNPAQPLKKSCGSLPFCAPEVFAVDPKRGPICGYNGLAADMWSLGVGFMELVLGLYSVEDTLGWGPEMPKDSRIILQGLQSLPGHWASVASQDATGLGKLVTNTVVLDPSARWGVCQLTGPAGLGLSSDGRPAASRGATQQRKGTRSGTNCSSYSQEGDRLSAPDAGTGRASDVGRRATSAASAFQDVFDALLRTSEFEVAYGACPDRLPSLRRLYTEVLPAVFSPHMETPDFEAVRRKVQESHAGLRVTSADFNVMLGILKETLRHRSVPEPDAAGICARMAALRPAFALGGHLLRPVAGRRCGPLTGSRGGVTIAMLTERLTEAAGRRQLLDGAGLSPEAVSGAVLCCLGPGAADAPGTRLVFSESGACGGRAVGKGTKLEWIGAVVEALEACSVEAEVVHTVRTIMHDEWLTDQGAGQ